MLFLPARLGAEADGPPSDDGADFEQRLAGLLESAWLERLCALILER